MCKQCVPGVFSPPSQTPGYEAIEFSELKVTICAS